MSKTLPVFRFAPELRACAWHFYFAPDPGQGRRTIATVSMFLGAAIGALVLLRIGTGAVLALALALLLIVLAAAAPHWRTTDAWTAP